MVRRCKFNRNMKCTQSACDDRCVYFRKIAQQTLFPKEPKVVRTKDEKGVKTTYYKVEK